MPDARGGRESHDERFARALAAADAYRQGPGSGSAVGLDEWLAAHADLRELLEPMLEADGDLVVESAAAVEAPAATVGTRVLQHFAHFWILGSLGGGGMGDVYLALDEKLGRKVALKVIRPEALWSQDAKLRFHREALAVGRLDHPNICRLHEAGEHEGWPFMALQLLKGETLAQSIAKSRAARAGRDRASSAPATRAGIMAIVLLIEQVARALHHAHEHGLIHRDVKPGNIMIDGDGRPVVLDFGLARDERNLEASLSSSRRGIGTPLYMSPEQIARTGAIDARTDVYSLGVTLYECLTHARPFDAPTEAELADQILANRYTDPRKRNRQLPPELALVIACALDRDPERRYRTALAMAEDLRRVLDLQPVHARPIGKALRLRRWVQRNPVLLGVGALAATALLGLGFAVKNAILAKERQGIATARADEARTSLDRFRLLSDVVQLQDGKTIERTLHPPYPEKAQAMRDWLREYGEPLTRRLPTLEAALVELRKKAKVHLEAIAGLGREDDGERFLHVTLSNLVRDLRTFSSEHGELSAVRRRLLEAESVLERSIGDHRAEWDAAIGSIARSDGVVASRLYDHLDLKPQIGLVPIGMDPDSKLWEFVHLASGELARRDEQGQLVISGTTGIVFVLIPPGIFAMGAQKEDALARNYDPAAQAVESPVHDVTLGPFFLSKFEMTQGQWRRLTDAVVRGGNATPVTLQKSVADVDWTMCDRLMTENGLCIPTEAQWEYGCRAGTTTPRWMDEADSLAANGFGLHDVCGGVREWCRDWMTGYRRPTRPGDGLRLGGRESRTFRGGRSAGRSLVRPLFRHPSLGLRPARVVTP